MTLDELERRLGLLDEILNKANNAMIKMLDQDASVDRVKTALEYNSEATKILEQIKYGG